MKKVTPFLSAAIIIGLLLHASVIIWQRMHAHVVEYKTPTHISGMIDGLPEYQKYRERFVLLTTKDHQKIRLTWYGRYPWLRPGEHWRLTVKTSPNLTKNNKGFNYSNWLKWHGYSTAAYVITKSTNKRLHRGHFWHHPIDMTRYELRWRLYKTMRGFAYRDILIALAMGDRSYLSKSRWQTFIHTGTSHLIAISGLHVGLLAGLIFFLLRWLFSLMPFVTRRIPAQHAAMIGAIIFAGLYSIIAGLAVTTIRAFVMLLVVAIGMLMRRKLSLLSGWLFALILISLLIPGNFASAGTWLSFGAVFCLYYVFANRLKNPSKAVMMLYPQWAVFIGLTPLVIYWFQKWSIVSLAANLIAIPMVSFIILPLALLGTVLAYSCQHLAHDVFWLANCCLNILWTYLHYLASRPWWGLSFKPITAWQCLIGSIGGLWLLAPRAFPARWLGLVLLSVLFI